MGAWGRRGRSLTMDTAQVDAYDEVKCVVEAVFHIENTEGAPQPCYECMAATTTQEQLTKVKHWMFPSAGFLWFIFNSFDSEYKQNWNANERAEKAHAHVSSHTHLHMYIIIHTGKRLYTLILRYNFCS